MAIEEKKMAIIAAQGTLDWAYPPLIMASTAAALDIETKVFFTFYGLSILKPKIEASISTGTNPAMPFQMPFGPKWLQKFSWPIPKIVTSNMPGFDTVATKMMKKTFQKKGVAALEELRDACIESDVTMIACQMTMDLFNIKKEDLIDGVETAGAATFLEFAADSDIQLFI